VRAFSIDAPAQLDLLAATVWYEEQREGLGDDFAGAVERVFKRVRDTDEFGTAPILRLTSAVVRRERTRRFPYAVYFVEDAAARRVIAVLHGRRDPSTWFSRI
jgi:plasmid stabilization system protein ParE